MRSSLPRSVDIPTEEILRLIVGGNLPNVDSYVNSNLTQVVLPRTYELIDTLLEGVVDLADNNSFANNPATRSAQFYIDYKLLRPIFDTMDRDRLYDCMTYIRSRLRKSR